MPTLVFATLAQGAQDVGGLISMLSGFVEGLQGPQFPIRQQLWFVGRVHVSEDEFDTPLLAVVRVEHGDGEQLARVEVTSVARKSPGYTPDLPSSVNLVVPLALEFRREGIYQVLLAMNGEPLGECLLRVTTQFPSV